MDRVTCRESCKRHMAVGGKVPRGKRGFSAMANEIWTRKCTTIRLWCSFAVPKPRVCSSSSSCCCCCCSCSTSDFRIFVGPKNRQMGCVCVCFWHSRSKKHCKYQCFWRARSPKPRYLRCCFASGSRKSLYLQCWYLRSFQHVARRTCFMPKAQKTL